jgi:hypothetical protein
VNEDFSEEILMLRIRNVYPGSRILIFVLTGSRISDPGSKNSKERNGRKKLVVLPFFVATNYFIFELVKKKFGSIYNEL